MQVVGIAGFVLSLVALAWNVWLTWMRWPRLAVTIRASVRVHAYSGVPPENPKPSEDTFRLVVVNHGAEAATISSIGLLSDGGSWILDYETRRANGESLPEGLDLPVRIEGHGSLSWIYRDEDLAIFRHGTKITGYVERYKPYRKWPKRSRTLTRRVLTPYAAHRNGGTA